MYDCGVGFAVGDSEGSPDGLNEGASDAPGCNVGSTDGCILGDREELGKLVLGLCDGIGVGAGVMGWQRSFLGASLIH